MRSRTKGLGWVVVVMVGALALAGGAAGDGVPVGTIQTVAGGNLGEGQPATSVPFLQPAGVAVDETGAAYFADSYRHRVFRIAPDGTLSSVAGSTLWGEMGGYSGDGGPATSAKLNQPVGIARDATGNLYIAERANSRVRKVGTDGVITTIAGNGTHGYSGDGGPATSAALRHPWAVAVDAAGSVYVADTENHRIRKVSGGVITTVVGTGTGGFSGDGGAATSAQILSPLGVAVDAAGVLYVSDSGNQRVRRVGTDGVITTVAGTGTAGYSGDGGPATAARLATPVGIFVDGSGDLLVADAGNLRVRRVDTTGTITTVAGDGAGPGSTGGAVGDGGPATTAHVGPYAVTADVAGNVVIADASFYRVRRVSAANGTIATVAGNGYQTFSGDGGPAGLANLYMPWGVAVDAEGNAFISDEFNYRVRRISADGTISTIDALIDYPVRPSGIAVDASGNVYVTEVDRNRVRRVTPAGTVTTIAGTGTAGFSGDGGPATSAKLTSPLGVAVDASGDVFVLDVGNQRIRKISSATGIITTVAGTGTAGFSGDGGPATSAQISGPEGLALDSEGNLYLADTGNNRVRRIAATTSTITTVAGNGTGGISGDGGSALAAQLYGPTGVVVDVAGSLFIADRSHRVRKVTGGVITTVAGNLVPRFSGDGGSATTASLNNPRGLAVTPTGDLLIADYQNSRVRRVAGAAAAAGVSISGSPAVSHECDGATGTSVPILLAITGWVPSGADLVVRDVTGGAPGAEVHRQAAVSGSMGFSATFPMGTTALVAEVVSSGGTSLATFSFTVQVADTTAPTLTGVAPATLELQGVLTAVQAAALGITASDACDPNPVVTLAPSELPLGTTTVTVTATDATGNSATSTVEVTIEDTRAPEFRVVPEDVSTDCAEGTGGATVVWDVLAEDLSGTVTLTCTDETGRAVAGSGAWFAVGDHVVTCAATDAAGNEALAFFRVQVADDEAPVLVLPADIHVGTDPGACWAHVAFTVAASDACSADVTITTTADGIPVASGDAFPCGTTTVTCTATDSWGNGATGTFRIAVADTEAPTLVAPTSITLVTGCAGDPVSISPSVLHATSTDNCDPAPILSCNPSTLGPGTTSVDVSAADHDGNVAHATVLVTLLAGPYDVAFLRPLEGGIDNTVQVGRVVPVQIRVTCGGVVQTDVTATIDDIVRIDGTGTPIAQTIDDAGLSSDDGTAMRYADGTYKYNLSTASWPSSVGARFRVTVRVAKAGHADALVSVILRSR